MSKDFQQLQDRIGSWSKDRHRSDDPRGTINHLKEETEDLLHNPYDIEAIADVFILMIETARRAGYSMDEVYQAVEAKHKINVSRIWEDADEHGITRYKKQGK